MDATIDVWVVAILLAVVVIAMGLVLIWREDTWRNRVEILRADFGRELAKRDIEIRRLNTIVETLVMQGRAGLINAEGDVNIAGDASGRDVITR